MKIPTFDYKKGIELYRQGLSVKEIGKKFNISITAIYYVLRKFGVKSNRNIRFSKSQEKQIIILYKNPKIKLDYICKKFKINETTIYAMCRRNSVSTKLKLATSKLNHFYFNKIDSEEKAYWLGFLMADGCVSTRDRIIFFLHERNQIVKFKQSLSCKSNIQIRKYRKKNDKISKNFGIEFNSKIMANNLKEYGVIQRKTTRESFPEKYIPNNLIDHFWRGAVDGDGWISNPKWMIKKRYKQPFGIGLCGCKIFVESFKSWCQKFVSTNANVKKCSKGNCYEFNLVGMNAIKLISILYDGSNIYLNRKYKTANRAIRQFKLITT